MKEMKLGVSKRLLMEKHPSAKILEVDVQQGSPKGDKWITRTSMSLTSEQLREMLKLAEGDT